MRNHPWMGKLLMWSIVEWPYSQQAAGSSPGQCWSRKHVRYKRFCWLTCWYQFFHDFFNLAFSCSMLSALLFLARLSALMFLRCAKPICQQCWNNNNKFHLIIIQQQLVPAWLSFTLRLPDNTIRPNSQLMCRRSLSSKALRLGWLTSLEC